MTGSAGHLGEALVRVLRAQGRDVVGLDLLDSPFTTVTGSVAQTQWGPVEVQLTVAGTKITRVEVLQYPNGNGRDQEINDYALPILTKETITAQSADIDMVTSDRHRHSIEMARAAGEE